MTDEQQKLILQLRRQLHQCPEVSGQEVKTKALLQQFLREHTTLELHPCGDGFYAAHREKSPEKPAVALRLNDPQIMKEAIRKMSPLKFLPSPAGFACFCVSPEKRSRTFPTIPAFALIQ